MTTFYPTSLNLLLAEAKAQADAWAAEGYPSGHPPLDLAYWAGRGIFTARDYWLAQGVDPCGHGRDTLEPVCEECRDYDAGRLLGFQQAA